MGFFSWLKPSGTVVAKEPEYVRTDNERGSTYKMHRGEDAESAKTFLMTKRVDKRQYFIVVETPEGNWGIDLEGLYLEQLLPCQKDTDSARCEGNIVPLSWSQFGLEMAARKYNDNFIVKVQCGKCECQWLDAIRYQDITVARCPKCKTLNKVNSGNIQVAFV